MYITMQETAEFLDMPEEYISRLIQQGKIRAIHDGEQYVINKDQFNTHLEQMEKVKQLFEEFWNEPIPEDIDVKDED